MNIDEMYDDYPRIQRFLWSLSKDRALAEDLAQETFARALGHTFLLSTLSKAQVRGWLLKTAKNLHTDWTRRKSYSAEIIDVEDLQLATKEVEYSEFRTFMSLVPEMYAAVLELRYAFDLNSQEIAAKLGIPAATVRRRLQKARHLLKEQLQGERE